MSDIENKIYQTNPQINVFEAKIDLEKNQDTPKKRVKSPYLRGLGSQFAKRVKLGSSLINTESAVKLMQTIKVSPQNIDQDGQESITNSEQSEASHIIRNFEKEEEELNAKRISLQLRKRNNTHGNQGNSNSSTDFKNNTPLSGKLHERIKNIPRLDTHKMRTPKKLISTVINADFSNRSHSHRDQSGFRNHPSSIQESSHSSGSVSGSGEIHIEDQIQKIGLKKLQTKINKIGTNFNTGEDPQQHSPQNVKNMMQKLFLNRLVNVSEFQVEFHFAVFIKFMLYHLMFFYMGPSSCIPVLIFDSKHVMNNMSFWVTTKNRASFIVQTLQWISCMIIIGSWIQKYYRIIPFVQIQLNYIYLEQLYFFNILVLIRSFVIAVRYGYSSNFRLNSLKKAKQEFDFIAQDLLIPNWINFNPDGLDLEIEGAMWRNQIEPETFKFTFIEELQKDMAERLIDKDYYKRSDSKKFQMASYQKQLTGFKKSIRVRRSSLDKLDIYNYDYDMFGLHSQKNISIANLRDKKYHGNLVLREIALFAGAHQSSTNLFLLIAVLGKIFLPFIARYIQYGIFTLDWDSSTYTTFDTLASSMFLFQNYLFVFAGFVDFQRRFLMMKSVGALLNPFKESYDVKYQIFPTINLASKESIYTWFLLRQCVMDFGKKYMMRVFMYSSVFLGMYLFLSAALILSFFGFLDFQFSMYFYLSCLYDIVFVLGVIMSMFYYGAIVNEEFVDNKLQLVKIKQTLLYVKFNLVRIISAQTKYTGAYLKIFQKIFQQIHQDRVAEFTKKGNKFSSEDVINSLKLQIDELVEQIESIIQRLEVENEHRPLKLLGLKATSGLMNQMYTTIFTIIVAVAQRFYSNQDGESSAGVY
eukprot:403339548